MIFHISSLQKLEKDWTCPSWLFLLLVWNAGAGDSLPVQRPSGIVGCSKSLVNSPPGERLCPCRGFSGLRTDKLSHRHGHVCLHTHRASQSLRDFCHHAVNHYPSRAVLFEISDLFCSPEGVYCSQRSLGRCLDCVLAASQLALLQSSEIRSLSRPHICASWEKGATPASISQGGVGSPRDTGWGGSSQVNFPWVIMRSCGWGICKNMGSGLKSSQVNRDSARRGPVFSKLCQAHEISASNLTRFMHTEKSSPASLCLSHF